MSSSSVLAILSCGPRIVAIGCVERFAVSQLRQVFFAETNIVGVFWSFQPFPDVLPAAEEGREIGTASDIWRG